ncbi:TLD-domain-containing protein, partial [Neocallimastix californiae]
SPNQILDTITAEKLRFHLPRRYRDYSSWELIFSLSEHGSSFLTLYDKIVGKGPLLMVIKDSNDQIFGAFIPESIKISSRYYGSGECFLWKKGNSQDQRSFKVFEWSGLNEHNVLTNSNTIAFGGGRQGRFGLSLDHNLEGGTTARCDTFKNEPLTLSSKFK